MSEPEGAPPSARWARLRFAVVASLLASLPDHGELQERIAAFAAQRWKHPSTGEPVEFDFKTNERWYYVVSAARTTLWPGQSRARRLRGMADEALWARRVNVVEGSPLAFHSATASLQFILPLRREAAISSRVRSAIRAFARARARGSRSASLA